MQISHLCPADARNTRPVEADVLLLCFWNCKSTIKCSLSAALSLQKSFLLSKDSTKWTLFKFWIPFEAYWRGWIQRGACGSTCIFVHWVGCTCGSDLQRMCGRAPWGSMAGRCPSTGWQSHLSRRETPWIYCTRCLIRMFNPLCSGCTPPPLQCEPGDPDRMELEWDRESEITEQGRESLFDYRETGRGLSDIISMSPLTPL